MSLPNGIPGSCIIEQLVISTWTGTLCTAMLLLTYTIFHHAEPFYSPRIYPEISCGFSLWPLNQICYFSITTFFNFMEVYRKHNWSLLSFSQFPVMISSIVAEMDFCRTLKTNISELCVIPKYINAMWKEMIHSCNIQSTHLEGF